MTEKSESRTLRQKIGLIAGPLLFAAILFLPAPEGMSPAAHRTFAVTGWMAVWWLTEAISISATALLPIVLFPVLGVNNIRTVTASYGDSNIYLYLGGFLLAIAMEKSKLHMRIAYKIVTAIGRNPRQVILGFMLATAFLSMWISNTATTLLMLPIAIAATIAVTGLKEIDDKTAKSFGTVIMLAIAYSASVGGIGTIVGTPPNIVFASSAKLLYPELPEIGFLQWMAFGLPVSGIMLPVIWIVLTRFVYKISGLRLSSAREVLQEKQRELGLMKYAEKVTLVVFILTALGWIFRKDIDLGSLVIPGWSNLFSRPEYINDAAVAVAAALLMFTIPMNRKMDSFLLTWRDAVKIPWGILILFGGGLALASSFASSGLSEWLGNNLAALKGLPTILFIFMIALMVTFLTEVTSNVATASVFMPIMGGLAVGVGFHPYMLMLPAVLSASCAFMA